MHTAHQQITVKLSKLFTRDLFANLANVTPSSAKFTLAVDNTTTQVVVLVKILQLIRLQEMIQYDDSRKWLSRLFFLVRRRIIDMDCSR